MALFKNAHPNSKLIGLFLCLVHLMVSWSTIHELATIEPDAQWQLIWVYYFWFDFPVSLFAILGLIVFPGVYISGLPYPTDSVSQFLIPAFVHGIFGPIWYYFIPVMVSHVYTSYRIKKM